MITRLSEMKTSRVSARRRAFTLLELVIVLGVILLLMSLVLGVGSIILRQSDDRQIRATMAIVDAALVEFEQQAGREIIFEGWSEDLTPYGDAGIVDTDAPNEEEYCGYVNGRVISAYFDIPFEPYADPRFIAPVDEGGFGWDDNDCNPWEDAKNVRAKWLAATLGILSQNPACSEIIAKADTALIGPVGCVEGELNGEPFVNTYNMTSFIDPWDRQVFIIFAGRTWRESDQLLIPPIARDRDGTIRTDHELKFGVCRSRRPLLISSGPDTYFGAWGDLDRDNDGTPDHQDNVYSYQPEKP
jgi:prepilin-type N-terminal cleavage/methylation domain-containing protein